MTHPDRRRYGGLDLAAPSREEMGPARFDANLGADFSADLGGAEGEGRPIGKLSADTATDFPAEPTGPAAAGYRSASRP